MMSLRRAEVMASNINRWVKELKCSSYETVNLMMKYRHVTTIFLICRKKSQKFQSAKMEFTEASEFILILNTKNFRESCEMCQDLASAHLRNSKSNV